jgi:undecaprenyl-diphosphatase
MELPGYARRMDGDRARRAAHGAVRVAVSAWREPAQRRLGLALAAAVLSAIAFAQIAEDYLTNDPLARWDVSFARWLAGERSTVGTDFFRALTFLGSPAVALAVSTVVCLLLYRRRRLVDAALLPLVLAGAELLNLVLKLSFHRPRPEVAFVHLDTYSFPSGHAMISTAAYGALAYVAWSRLQTRRAHVLLAAGTAVLLALICFSRLYLGVHYLSDVLAGAAGGVFWLSVAIALQTIYGERFAARFTDSRLDRLGRRVMP